jgi:hypothetical protein
MAVFADMMANRPEEIVNVVNQMIQQVPNVSAEAYVLGRGIATTAREYTTVRQARNPAPEGMPNQLQVMQASWQQVVPVRDMINGLLQDNPNVGTFRQRVQLPNGNEGEINISRNSLNSVANLLRGVDEGLNNNAALQLPNDIQINAPAQPNGVADMPPQVGILLQAGVDRGHVAAQQVARQQQAQNQARPTSKWLIGGGILVACAATYGIYKYFFAKPEKKETTNKEAAPKAA